MSFKDMMADDVETILSLCEHEETTTLTSIAGAPAGSINVIPGLINENFLTDAHGNNDQSRMDIWTSLADAVTILARTPQRGDTFTFPTASAYAGIWTIQTVKPDNSGGITCTSQLETVDADAGHNALKVDG